MSDPSHQGGKPPSEHPEDDEPMEEEEAEERAMLDPDEADEVVPSDDDEPMDSDPDDDNDAEIPLQNDSLAYFDTHNDSIFSIAAHPLHSNLIATGGGDDLAYIFEATPAQSPLLPRSYQSNPSESLDNVKLKPLAKLDGHTDSVAAITWTLPQGNFVVTGGLDGQIRAWKPSATDTNSSPSYELLGHAQEVEEVNWLAPCLHPSHPNTFALGASDGSVWVYSVSASGDPLTIIQAYYLHTASCTAGAWTPAGNFLATVSEDGSLYVWDVFGDAAAAGLLQPGGSAQTVVGLTAADERFRVETGFNSVAVSPGGAFVAVGGGEGQIHVVGLPRLSDSSSDASSGAKAKAKAKSGGKPQESSQGQAGQILATLQVQSESVETIAFSAPPLTLMAAGSVDGSIALVDCARSFGVRRHIKEAHEGEAVIKVAFMSAASTAEGAEAEPWSLTSCGNDGVVRRWDARGTTATGPNGLITELKGHRGGGDGGGVLGFVQTVNQIVTAGDDGVSLVFPTRTDSR